MYKLLLCWRYLRTRYIALVSIVSVMLGVATLIVTNAVMEGFKHELEVRTRGALSDIMFKSRSLDGVPDAEWHMKEIRKVAGEYIDGMSPTVAVPAMLSYSWRNGNDPSQQGHQTRQITLVGIDEATYSSVSDLGAHLQHPDNRKRLDFMLKEGGYDVVSESSELPIEKRRHPALEYAGWWRRRQQAKLHRPAVAPEGSLDDDPFRSGSGEPAFDPTEREGTVFDPVTQQHTGCVLSAPLCGGYGPNGVLHFMTIPGDDVEITFPSAGTPPKPFSAKFTIVDVYDNAVPDVGANFVFVPIRDLQRLRGMIDPSTGIGNFSSIMISTKPGTDLNMVRDLLANHFGWERYAVSTWRDEQAPILGAIQVEIGILNVLLFLIIAVAGFGILAIFFMIVVEKTRDIGILKSLGATGRGIMSIFVLYGLALGILGSGVGLGLGLLIVKYIDQIAEFLGWLFGQPMFDPAVYGLEKLPTILYGHTIVLVIVTAIGIAVLSSILPAMRAARLHPVEALRYE